jgi:hypothetical protein
MEASRCPTCRAHVPASSYIDVESFDRLFAEKFTKLWSATSDSPPLTFSRVRSGVAFRSFSPLATDDVINAARRLRDKSSAADPVPTPLPKQVADMVAPCIVELFKRSLAAGHFPAAFKKAFVTSIGKKPGLNATDIGSYRPIASLSVLLKFLERAPSADEVLDV